MVHWWVLVHSGPYILPLPTSSRFEEREPPDSRKYQCWAVLSRNAGSLPVFRPDIGLYHQWFPFHESLTPRSDPEKNCSRIQQEQAFVSSDGWFFNLAPVIFWFLDRLYNITAGSCMTKPLPPELNWNLPNLNKLPPESNWCLPKWENLPLLQTRHQKSAKVL